MDDFNIQKIEYEMIQENIKEEIKSNLFDKSYYPGYSYSPPHTWEVPQRQAPICLQKGDCLSQPVPIYDKGTPLNALEYYDEKSTFPKIVQDKNA